MPEPDPTLVRIAQSLEQLVAILGVAVQREDAKQKPSKAEMVRAAVDALPEAFTTRDVAEWIRTGLREAVPPQIISIYLTRDIRVRRTGPGMFAKVPAARAGGERRKRMGGG